MRQMQECSYPSLLKKAFRSFDFFSRPCLLGDESANRNFQLRPIFNRSRHRLRHYFADLRFIRKIKRSHACGAWKSKKEKRCARVIGFSKSLDAKIPACMNTILFSLYCYKKDCRSNLKQVLFGLFRTSQSSAMSAEPV